jgi:hypothetical protein
MALRQTAHIGKGKEQLTILIRIQKHLYFGLNDVKYGGIHLQQVSRSFNKKEQKVRKNLNVIYTSDYVVQLRAL